MYKSIFSFFLLFLSLSASAQWDKWQVYLAYYNTTGVTEANDRVFAVADGSLYAYDQEDTNLKTYSKLDGLSDTGISLISYNADIHSLLVVYSNGNLDILSEDGIYNVPFLKTNTGVQDKEIRGVFFQKERAYLPAAFGIMVLDMKKKEISDTYKVGNVYGTCVIGNDLYAATQEGLIKGSLSDNLADKTCWKTYEIASADFEASEIRNIGVLEGKICFFVPEKGIYYAEGNSSIRPLLEDEALEGMKMEAGKLLAFSGQTAYVARSLSALEKIPGLTSVKDISALKNNGKYWIASGTGGLKGIKSNGKNSSYQLTVDGLAINSPKRNLPYFMAFDAEQLLVTGGARWADRENQPATFMRYRENQWINFDESVLPKQTGMDFCRDFLCAVTDPADTSHFFVASYGEGIFEFKEGKFVQMYNLDNSGLESASPTWNPRHYVRVSGLAFDKEGNLWVVSSGVEGTVKIFTKDGKWITLNTPAQNIPTTDKLLIAQNGYKFVNCMRLEGTAGILAIDDGGTVENTADDTYKFYTNLTSTQGESVPASTYHCLAEDKNGAIWVGTNIGPVVCYSSNRIDDLRFNRIVLADESDYLLNGEQINAIAVDGGNQKWIATENSGVFLVSEDGTEVLENFTTENSPLLSDRVQSLAINPHTGEVFIGTDKGIISYMGDATEGSDDFSSVHAYPNPVRPDYDGKVIITGLMDQSSVKITDVSGNLVYQGKCTGGQFAWDCRNYQGRRVASGVYLVLAATPKAKESVVTKVMVVK